MRLHPDVERLALLGWRLHPATRSASRAACIKNAAELATSDLDQLGLWAWEFPACNWRVVLGGSGVWAMDVDAPGPDHAANGVQVLAGLVKRYGPLPERPTTRSGGGGYALFFAHRGEPIAGKSGTPAPGLDPRRGRLSVTIPPSVHHRTRKAYRWLIAPWEMNPPPAPAWLLQLVAPPPLPVPPATRKIAYEPGRAYAVAALRNSVVRVASAPPGQRNDALNASVWSLTRFIPMGTLDASEIADALAHAGRAAGLDRSEVQQTLTSALRAGAKR